MPVVFRTSLGLDVEGGDAYIEEIITGVWAKQLLSVYIVIWLVLIIRHVEEKRGFNFSLKSTWMSPKLLSTFF